MLYNLDLFTGIATFHEAGRRNGGIQTLCCSEIDKYNIEFINKKLLLENAGDIAQVAISRDAHSDQALIEQDLVPVEETGLTSLCIEDFLEGILPFPHISTGGFPCQNISPSNLLDQSGISGSKSSLVEEQLRIIESIDIPINIFENSERLNKRGLHHILKELNRMGYIVEWDVISATVYGYPHYRHRMFIVAYFPWTSLGQNNIRVFDEIRKKRCEPTPFKFPLLHEDPEYIKQLAVAEDPKSIYRRTKRINSLGNAIVVDIPQDIFEVISKYESAENLDLRQYDLKTNFQCNRPEFLNLSQSGWESLAGGITQDMPSSGVMFNGKIYSENTPCPILNTSKKKYTGLYPSLIGRDGNNNYTTKSRLNRPGGLGGVVGHIMKSGVTTGGLHPHFAELMMGLERGYTALPEHEEKAILTKQDQLLLF